MVSIYYLWAVLESYHYKDGNGTKVHSIIAL